MSLFVVGELSEANLSAPYGLTPPLCEHLYITSSSLGHRETRVHIISTSIIRSLGGAPLISVLALTELALLRSRVTH